MRKKLLIKLFIPFVLLIFLSIAIIGLSSKNPSPTLQSGWVLQTNLQSQLRGRTVSDMAFTDSVTGYAVTPWINTGDSTFIFKTTNGGDNWYPIVSQPKSMGGFNRIKFINKNTGFTCGDYFKKTTNAGINWVIINASGISAEMMYVLNEDTIFLTNSESMTGGVFRTTNGGQNWQQIYAAGMYNPADIYMFNARIGFYSQDKLYKTTNGGFNWSIINDTNYFYLKLVDTLFGYRARTQPYSMQVTTNGGYNWASQRLPVIPGVNTSRNVTYFSMYYKDTVWLIGGTVWYPNPGRERGLIFKTTNGGLNWGYQLPDTHLIQIPVYHFIKNIGANNLWAYNKNGYGIHTTVGGDSTIYTNIKEQITNISSQFKLEQNYPNPFNQVSSIKYQVLRRADIKLIVYNITGREIITLVNKNQNSGNYNVKFEGSNLSSGVYFYSLFVEGIRVDTKKLMLIK